MSLIILAHVSPPYWLQQARCFDVPLMLFISGLTCSNKAIASYKDFVVKRFKRLVYPVWFFLILYFTLILIAQSFNLIPNYLTGRKILESFLLLDGIGYVWIIRVFLLIMLITPLLQKINNVIKNDYVFIVKIAWTRFYYHFGHPNRGYQPRAFFISKTMTYTVHVVIKLDFYIFSSVLIVNVFTERRAT